MPQNHEPFGENTNSDKTNSRIPTPIRRSSSLLLRRRISSLAHNCRNHICTTCGTACAHCDRTRNSSRIFPGEDVSGFDVYGVARHQTPPDSPVDDVPVMKPQSHPGIVLSPPPLEEAANSAAAASSSTINNGQPLSPSQGQPSPSHATSSNAAEEEHDLEAALAATRRTQPGDHSSSISSDKPFEDDMTAAEANPPLTSRTHNSNKGDGGDYAFPVNNGDYVGDKKKGEAVADVSSVPLGMVSPDSNGTSPAQRHLVEELTIEEEDDVSGEDGGAGVPFIEYAFSIADGLEVTCGESHYFSFDVVLYLLGALFIGICWLALWTALPPHLTEPAGAILGPMSTIIVCTFVGQYIVGRNLGLPSIVGVFFVSVIWNHVYEVGFLSRGTMDVVRFVISRIGLTTILVRAGMALSWKSIRPTVFYTTALAVIPLAFETVASAALSHTLFSDVFDHDWRWSFLYGLTCSVVAAGVIAPEMLNLITKGYTQGVPPLALSAVGPDTAIGVWALGFVVQTIFSERNINLIGGLGPVQLFGGLIIGVFIAFLFSIFLKLLRRNMWRNPTAMRRFTLICFISVACTVVFFGERYVLVGGEAIITLSFATAVGHLLQWEALREDTFLEKKILQEARQRYMAASTGPLTSRRTPQSSALLPPQSARPTPFPRPTPRRQLTPETDNTAGAPHQPHDASQSMQSVRFAPDQSTSPSRSPTSVVIPPLFAAGSGDSILFGGGTPEELQDLLDDTQQTILLTQRDLDESIFDVYRTSSARNSTPVVPLINLSDLSGGYDNGATPRLRGTTLLTSRRLASTNTAREIAELPPMPNTSRITISLSDRKHRCAAQMRADLVLDLCDFWNDLVAGPLFSMSGSLVDLTRLFSVSFFPKGILILGVGAVVRMIATALCTLGMGWSWKEITFLSLIWLGKGSVQAATGGVALEAAQNYLEGLPETATAAEIADAERMVAAGRIILNTASLYVLVAAPLCAICITKLGPLLLTKPEQHPPPLTAR